jgi:hypothetical protein
LPRKAFICNCHWVVCGIKYASIEQVDARDLSPKPDRPFRVRWLGSTRHKELASSESAAVGDCWRSGRIWNDLCCDARPNRNAQAPVERGHEPKNGSNHGCVSGPLGLLRFIDSFATSGAMEHHRGVGQFAERRRVLVLRPRRKTSTTERIPSSVGPDVTVHVVFQVSGNATNQELSLTESADSW